MNNYQELLPTGYQWVKKQSIFGYEPFSQLQPWYLLSEEKIFWVHKNWKTDKKILVFAQRQDCDSLAGINFDENLNEFNEIITNHQTMETSFKNIYAIGDVRDTKIRQILTGMSDAIYAIHDILSNNSKLN